MSASSEPPCARRWRRRVQVLTRELLLDGFVQVQRDIIRYERYDGGDSGPLTRVVVVRPEAVAVLPYERATRRVILVQQFRYPAHVAEGTGWLWEAIAGVCEAGRSTDEAVRAEALEEAGYRLDLAERVMTVYSSPGWSVERVHLYVAPVTPQERIAPGGGLAEGGEDIIVGTFSLDEALQMSKDGRIVDAKTILLLQYAALHWQEL